MVVSYTPVANQRPPHTAGDQDWQYAQSLVDMEYDPKRNQLLRNIDSMTRDRDRQVNTQTMYGELADPQIKSIYDELGTRLQSGVEETDALYGAGVEQVGGFYDNATGSVQSATDRIIQQMNSNAERLNLQQAIPDANRPLYETLLKATSRNATSKAGAQSNIAGMGMDMGALARGRVSDAARQGAMSRSELINNIQRSIADIQLSSGEAMFDTYGGLGDIEDVRGKALVKAYEDAFNSRTERERQAKLDALAEEIQRNTMRLQNQGFAADQSNQAFTQRMALSEEQRAQQAHAAEMAQAQLALQMAQSESAAMAATQRIQALASRAPVRSGPGATYRPSGASGRISEY